MTFIALIVALLVATVWENAHSVHEDDWFSLISARVERLQLGEPVTLAVLVLGPMLLVMLLLSSLTPVLFGLAWLLAAAFVLLYSLGRGEFESEVRAYTTCIANADYEGAWLHLRQWFDIDAEDEAPESPAALRELALTRIGYEGYQRRFAVLFWFVVAGPGGALAYRLLQLRHLDASSETTAWVLTIVDWVPCRLLALGFALTGDFVASVDELGETISEPAMGAAQVIYRVGGAALRFSPLAQNESEHSDNVSDSNMDTDTDTGKLCALLSRSWIAWLAIWSCVVVIG